MKEKRKPPMSKKMNAGKVLSHLKEDIHESKESIREDKSLMGKLKKKAKR
jgi:hypothetical protein